MKALFAICILCLMISKSGDQSWVPVSESFSPGNIAELFEDTINDRLIISGAFGTYGEVEAGGFLIYDGENYETYGCAYNCVWPGGNCAGPFTIANYKDTLYMQGAYLESDDTLVNNISGTEGLCAFLDTNWLAVENGPSEDWVTLVETIGDSLFVFSTGSLIAGIETNGAAIYNGETWSPLWLPDEAENDFVYDFTSFTKFLGNYYVTGNFVFDNGGNDIMKWNGEGWNEMTIDIADDEMSSINLSLVFKDELYIGGTFQRPSGNAGEGIMKWNGENWTDLGTGIFNGQVEDMLVWNDELYVCGLFFQVGDIPAHNIAKWDGNKWCSLGADFDGTYVRQIGVYRDSLYAAAYTTEFGFCLYKWDGIVDTCSIDFNLINESELYNHLSLFPNPTTNELSIESNTSISRLEVSDITGRHLFTSQPNASQTKVNVESLSTGCYFLTATLENGTRATRKFLKE